MFPAPAPRLTLAQAARIPNRSEDDAMIPRDVMPLPARWAGPRFGAPFSTTRRIGE